MPREGIGLATALALRFDPKTGARVQ